VGVASQAWWYTLDVYRSGRYLVGMSTTVGTETITRPLNELVAENIRIRLAIARMSQTELSRRLGHSSAWISYKQSGRQPWDVDELQRVCTIFDIPIERLFTTRQLSPSISRRPDRPRNRHDSARPAAVEQRNRVIRRPA